MRVRGMQPVQAIISLTIAPTLTFNTYVPYRKDSRTEQKTQNGRGPCALGRLTRKSSGGSTRVVKASGRLEMEVNGIGLTGRWVRVEAWAGDGRNTRVAEGSSDTLRIELNLPQQLVARYKLSTLNRCST